MLQKYLDRLADAGWSDVRPMPVTDDGKKPIIKGKCELGDQQAETYLHTADEAVEAVRNGRRGFLLYAGRDSHGTAGLCFTDHDDVELWPPDSLPNTLTVRSGSGSGYHQTYRNSGNIDNAKGKDGMKGAGEVRAENWYVVLPGTIHPTGGIYHIISTPEIGELHLADLPRELRPGSMAGGSDSSSSNSRERIEVKDLPEDFDPDSVFNSETVSLGVIRAVSPRLDSLLNKLGLAEYESLSEEDQGTVRLLLYWRFDEDDISKILRACRNREKVVRRDDYVRKTIRHTTIEKPIDEDLLDPLVSATLENGGRPPAGPESLRDARDALQALGGTPTTTAIVESPHVDWRGSKKASVRKRVNRALDLLSRTDYVTKTKNRGRNAWQPTGIEHLHLPTDAL
jgi:hypothetical protein